MLIKNNNDAQYSVVSIGKFGHFPNLKKPKLKPNYQ